MAHKIVWLPKAEKRYDEIIEWLKDNWTDKEITNFILRTDEVLMQIGLHPEMYRLSEKKNIRQAVVTKHNLLLYRKKDDKIELITFFDTRQRKAKKFK